MPTVTVADAQPTLTVALGDDIDERKIPLTLIAGEGQRLPCPLVLQLTGIDRDDGGGGIGQEIGFSPKVASQEAGPEAGSLRPLIILLPIGRTARATIVVAKGSKNAGTFNGTLLVNARLRTLATVPLSITARARSRWDLEPFWWLFIGGVVGGLVVGLLPLAGKMGSLQRRFEGLTLTLRGVDYDWLPPQVQQQMRRLRDALAVYDTATAESAAGELEKRLAGGRVVNLALGPIRAIREGIDQPSLSQSDREQFGRELNNLLALTWSDVDAAVQKAEVLLAELKRKQLTLAQKGDPAQPESRLARLTTALRPKGRRHWFVRFRRWLMSRWRRWGLRTAAFLLGCAVVAFVGWAVLYLEDPTFGQAGLRDWFTLAAWGFVGQASGLSIVGFVTAVAGKRTPGSLVASAEAPRDAGSTEDRQQR